jgi:adenylyl-sulfate kinase
MIKQQLYNITRQQRETKNGHQSFVVWFTGLSGSGKSTLANLVEEHLFKNGMQVYVLDGDNIRSGINKDLDFSKEGRKENIRRVAEIARLFCDAGTIVMAAFISPFEDDRNMAKAIIGPDSFIEVFADAPVACCTKRDVKGFYKKAGLGEIKNFTGVSDAYEPPAMPAIHLHTDRETPQQSSGRIISWLADNGYITI